MNRKSHLASCLSQRHWPGNVQSQAILSNAPACCCSMAWFIRPGLCTVTFIFRNPSSWECKRATHRQHSAELCNGACHI